jgi:hypothetical protein
MKTTYKVTNPEKFMGVRVILDGLYCTDRYNGIKDNFCAVGDITIIKNGEQDDYLGEHGAYDYENEFGFVLIPEE